MGEFEAVRTAYVDAVAGLTVAGPVVRAVRERESQRAVHLQFCTWDGYGVCFALDFTRAPSGAEYLSIKEPTAVYAAGGEAYPIASGARWRDSIVLPRGWHRKEEDDGLWLLKLFESERPEEIAALAYSAMRHTVAGIFGAKGKTRAAMPLRPFIDNRRLMVAWPEKADEKLRAAWPKWLTSPDFATTRQAQLAAYMPGERLIVAAVSQEDLNGV